MTQFVELSHPIIEGMTTYPGIPGPVLSDYLSWADSRGKYAPGTEFQIGRIEMIANTGTYLDTAAHRHQGRADLSAVALDRLADLPGARVDAPDRAVDAALLAEALRGHSVRGGAVLVHTGWDQHWGTSAYGDPAPYLTADAVAWLVEQQPALVGIDSVNIDDTADPARPAHTGLLDADIVIVEHLTALAALPTTGFRFFATPPRVVGMATFPVRAFAITQ